MCPGYSIRCNWSIMDLPGDKIMTYQVYDISLGKRMQDDRMVRYSYILLDAIYTVRGEPGFQDSDLLKTRLRDELQKLQPDIGSMTPVYCDDVCKFRPNCFTGKNFIDEMTRFST